MKKILPLFSAFLLVLMMAACSADSGGSQTSNTTTASQTVTTTESASTTEDPGPDMITGTLYAVFAKDDVREFDFGYEDGTCTPEKIATALSEWTGLRFDIVSEIDQEHGTVIVDWQSGSSFAEGAPPDPQKEDFFFYEQDSLRWFMLNSMCRTIRKNLEGDYDVYYAIEGGDLNDLGLGVDFNPAIAYNKIDNKNVLG